MQVKLYCNEQEAPLTPFIGKFVGNVCAAITSALKTPQPFHSLIYEIEGDTVRIQVNKIPVALNLSRGFSRIIILDTLRGMIRNLKMEDPNGNIRIEVNLEAEF
jgi:hypothetical protein